MADAKYSALALVAPTAGQIFGVDDAGTSHAITVSSAVSFNTSSQGILFNNQGQVSTDVASFQYHFSTQVQHLAGSSSQIWMNSVVAQPTTTGASTMAFYARTITGAQIRPVFLGPLGLERPLQVSLYDDSIFAWYPTTSAPGRALGGDTVTFGTYTSVPGVVGGAYSTKRKGVYLSSTGAAGQTAGIQSPTAEYFQGSTSGYGGWFFFCRFGFDTWATSTRYLVGMTAAASSAVCTSNTLLPNTVGFSFNDNVTTWGFYHASNSAVPTTEAITGNSSFASGLGYDAYIYAPANTTVIYYRLDELNTGSTIVNSSVANFLPNSTTFLRPVAMCGTLTASNGAARIGVIKLYCETDI